MHNLPLPVAIREAPELLIGLDLYWQAFMDLNSCRQLGVSGVGPIPWTAIIAYCEQGQVTGDQQYAMIQHIQAMDAAYLEHWHKKQEAERK